MYYGEYVACASIVGADLPAHCSMGLSSSVLSLHGRVKILPCKSHPWEEFEIWRFP